MVAPVGGLMSISTFIFIFFLGWILCAKEITFNPDDTSIGQSSLHGAVKNPSRFVPKKLCEVFIGEDICFNAFS